MFVTFVSLILLYISLQVVVVWLVFVVFFAFAQAVLNLHIVFKAKK